MSLQRKLLLIFGMPLLLLLATPILFKLNSDNLLETSFWVDHTHRVIAKGIHLEKIMIDMETGIRGFLLTGNKEFLEPYHHGKNLWPQEVKILIQTVSDNPIQVEQLKTIEQLESKWQNSVASPTIVVHDTAQSPLAVSKEQVKPLSALEAKALMDNIRIELNNFIEHERDLIVKRINHSKGAVSKIQTVTYYCSIFSIVLVLISIYIINRNIINSIQKMVIATQKVSIGDYDIHIEQSSHDELGILAKSFNQMAQTIDHTQKSLLHSSKMASLGSMAASIAHKLNQPLGAITLNSESSKICLERNKHEQLKTLLDKNIDLSQRASDIIHALSHMSRKDNNPNKIKSDLNVIVKDVIKIIEPDFKQNQIKLNIDFLPNPPLIEVAEVQIGQVISNLILNAIDALEGQTNKKIDIRIKNVDDYLLLQIEDNGQGMPEDSLKHIFEPFYTTKPIGKGTGLGLSISYGIIKSHSAKIEVKSHPGIGTTFDIYFQIPNEGEN